MVLHLQVPVDAANALLRMLWCCSIPKRAMGVRHGKLLGGPKASLKTVRGLVQGVRECRLVLECRSSVGRDTFLGLMSRALTDFFVGSEAVSLRSLQSRILDATVHDNSR